MKLRIRGDSLRLRLTRSEVRELMDLGRIADTTRFPDGSTFRYELRSDAAAGAIEARVAAGTVVVTLPKAAADGWGATEQVGLRAEIALGQGQGALLVLVEKDFPCLTARPDEDDGDAFERDALTVGR